MPAQISHILFAEQTLHASLADSAEEILERHGNLFRFGAQGPDFFYHNQRIRPSGLKYGAAAHGEGYGRLMAHMVREILRLQAKAAQGAAPAEAVEPLKAYTLGFATHAFLDRKTHPFIEYFSGWGEEYFRAHIFYERILDVLMLRTLRGQEVGRFALLAQLQCGKRLPYLLVKTLLKALNAAYPRMDFKSRDRRRIENAYTDSLAFYTFTDPSEPKYRRIAYERDRAGDNRRRLALFHPTELTEGVDFLNAGHGSWMHPCRGDWVFTSSFPELYGEAVAEAVPALRVVASALGGEEAPEAVEEAVGNRSLNTGLDRTERCALEHCAPLPLAEILEEIYERFDASSASAAASN